MTTILEKALNNVSKLPQEEQDQLGERLLNWYEMRSAITSARTQADNRDFSTLTAEEIIAKARGGHDTR